MSYGRTGSKSTFRWTALGLTLLVAVLAAGAPAAQEQRGAQRLQDSAQPNPQEVRPASPNGDRPSETAGRLARQPKAHRLLGLPVDAVMWIGGGIVVLLLLAAVIASRPARRRQAQGGGTYGRGPGN
jgi:hypothetical protein